MAAIGWMEVFFGIFLLCFFSLYLWVLKHEEVVDRALSRGLQRVVRDYPVSAVFGWSAIFFKNLLLTFTLVCCTAELVVLFWLLFSAQRPGPCVLPSLYLTLAIAGFLAGRVSPFPSLWVLPTVRPSSLTYGRSVSQSQQSDVRNFFGSVVVFLWLFFALPTVLGLFLGSAMIQHAPECAEVLFAAHFPWALVLGFTRAVDWATLKARLSHQD